MRRRKVDWQLPWDLLRDHEHFENSKRRRRAHLISGLSGLSGLSAIYGGFSPNQISNLAAWYSADQGLFQDSAMTTPATADADPVGGWQDLSGNAKHFTQATGASRPTLKLAIQNGRPVVRFDGVDDFLGNASLTPFTGAFFLMGVVKKVAGADGVFLSGQADSNFSAAFRNSLLTLCGFKAGIAAFDTTTPYTAAFRVPAWWGTGGANFTLNCSDDNANASTVSVTSITAETAAYIGCNRTTPANFLSGDVGELALYSRVLSATEQTQLALYFKAKWATP